MGLFTRAHDFGPQIATIAAEVASLRTEVARLGDRIERGSTVALRADLDNLNGRLESLAASVQRQFGRIYAQRAEPQPAGDSTGDPEVDELLEFQQRMGGASH